MNAEDIKKLVEQKAAIDPRLRSIVRRMESGTATFKETSEYSRIFSEIVGDTLSEHVLSLEEREAVANELLRYGYENINSILARVQTDIDRKNRVNIRPQKASFPQERAEQFSHSLTDPTVPDETIERRANNGTANITMSFHDDYMRENAEFRSNAGLHCYIDRQTNGKCCTWCSDIAGRYDYGNEPQDVYRRHDNCDCTVTYENGRQRQDVWSKRSWEVPKNGLKYTKPTVISREKARELEQRNLAQIRGINDNVLEKFNDWEENSESGISGKHLETTGENTVDLEYIKSSEYKNKFKTITNNSKVNEVIYKQAKAALTHRNGTSKEDMWLINAETAAIEGRQTNSQSEYGVDYNNSLKDAIKRNKPYSLISLHNHPTNNPPTGSDLSGNAKKKYALGVVVTHNGKVYSYKAGEKPFFSSSFDKRVDKYRGIEYNMSEEEAILQTLIDFSNEYGIEWREH